MPRPVLQRFLSALLLFSFLLSGLIPAAFADEILPEESQTYSEPTEATEESTEPTQPPTEATEPPTEATEAPSEPPSEPTEETTQPATEPTDPTIPALPEEPTEATKPTGPFRILPIEEESEESGPQLYFGQLHAHSSISGSQETAQALFTAAASAGMDFFAVTDLSDGFDNAASASLGENASLVSQSWASGKAAAAAAGKNCTGLFGFEMNWPEQMQIGHISVFHTPGFRSWEADAYKNPAKVLKDFYGELAALPGAIGQWNHPGTQYGTFFGFDHYSAEADAVITLMEVAYTQASTAAEYLSGYQYYTRALDKGWHIAPTNSQGQNGRTVVFAASPAESSLYDAMGSYRVYATDDSDLEITYTLDGWAMGSILGTWQVGETADIFVDLYDPTDNAIGLVEVIVDGGAVAACQTLNNGCDVLRFSLPATSSYYFLRITQPDGDIAVTAPVWLKGEEQLGISSLQCETAVPVQGEETILALEVYNHEATDFLVESLEILADGEKIAENTELTQIPAGSRLSRDLSFRYPGIGQTEITVILSGTLDGIAREYEETLSLSFRQSEQVTDILIDGSHANAGLSDLGVFKAMAAGEDIRVTTATTGITRATLQNCRFLVVTAPGTPFDQAFLDTAAEYVQCGGSILLCGQSEQLDGDNSSAEELNRLLNALDSSMVFRQDTAVDSISNGGAESALYLDTIDRTSPWCQGLTAGQVYRHVQGCTLVPGSGRPLVSGRSTTQSSARVSPVTLAAWEDTAAGGVILIAGSLLPGSGELQEPANIWDTPYANRTIVQNLLGIGGETVALHTIRQAREAAAGTLLRIRGYVTAGTAKPQNRFPDTLYLQDDTGGIAVIPFSREGITSGTPIEVTGTVRTESGNTGLSPVSCQVLEGSAYRYPPATGDWKQLLDPALYGGELVEVEGKCTEVFLTEDDRVYGIALKDDTGNTAYISIEPNIGNGSDGENDLHKDIRKNRTVRAMGILHVDAAGDPVIRVRNCEEVVYVPPWDIYINPRTGDTVLLPAASLLSAAAALLLLKRKKR